jgi:streptothricin acetyltransferase
VYLYYFGDTCVGQIRLRKNWNKYAFIEDIAVACANRRQGIGKELLDKAKHWAIKNKLDGFMLETQDINLSACKFYKKYGFDIGAVDTMLYANFDNHDEKAVFWYMKFEG